MPHDDINRVDITLVDPESDPTNRRYRRLRVADGRLVRETWTGQRKPRVTTVESVDERQTWNAFRKEKDRRLREGFVLVRDPSAASPGEVVLEWLSPHPSTSDAFDLHPDGGTLVVGTMLDQAYGAEIRLVDVATGRARVVHREPPGERQTFLHAVLFDADGTNLVYALNEQTWRLDLATRERRLLADYRRRHPADETMNPFCVRPTWDAARRRLLLFDADDTARVLDAAGGTLFELSMASPTTQCRAGALSRSGRLLALYRPSRGVTYRHADASDDTSNIVQIWDVDQRKLLSSIPFPHEIVPRALGFDPTEELVVAAVRFAEGPCAVSVETGELVWAFTGAAERIGRWATCYGWAYSPDGKTLAVGGDRTRGVGLWSAATREPADVTPQGEDRQRIHRLVHSADGRLLAAGGDCGRVVVRRL